MDIDPRLLDILACPACSGAVAPAADGDALRCAECGRSYPVRDGIPVMIVDEAVGPERGGRDS